MFCLFGVDILNEKVMEVLLIYLFGVGFKIVCDLCYKCGIDVCKKVWDLMDEELSFIGLVLECDYMVEGLLCC